MELYTWEYEGRKYYGFMRYHRLWGKGEDDVIEAVLENEVTNLRPAKVVDADAVVIELEIKARIVQQSKMLLHDLAPGSHQHDSAKKIIAALCPTPPVTEPKAFGAIVEADYEPKHHGKHGKFIFNGVDWILEGTLYNYGWSDLINPTILSEGLK